MRTHFIYRQQNSWNHSMNANRFSIHSIPFGSINSMFIGTRFIQTYFWWTRSTNNYYGNKFIPINIFISADLFFTSFTFTRSLFLFCNFHFCGVPVLLFLFYFFRLCSSVCSVCIMRFETGNVFECVRELTVKHTYAYIKYVFCVQTWTKCRILYTQCLIL